MIVFRLAFSEQEMIEFFKTHDLLITDVTFSQHVPVYHNRTEEQQITTKCVVNPNDKTAIPVSVAFERVVLRASKHLLLDNITKLNIIEALNPNNKKL